MGWPTEQISYKTKITELIDSKIKIAIDISNKTLKLLEDRNKDESFGPCIWSFEDLITGHLPAILRNLDSNSLGEAQESVKDAESAIYFCSENFPPDMPEVKSANGMLNDLLTEISDLIKLLK